MNGSRYNSEQVLAMITDEVSVMSGEAVASAIIVEGTPDDDSLLGRLFRLSYVGTLSDGAYATLYSSTDEFGKFATPQARLVAARMLRSFRR
jgi:acetyl-CoA carboxylase carboxyltransferase component